MKKILSLVLALLMLSSLAVTAGAAGEVFTFSDLIDFYKYYNSDKNPYEDLGDKLAGGFYTRWFDTCPKCSGLALFRVEKSAIKYTCMESKCGASGSYDVLPDKDETTETEKPNGITTIECGRCDRIATYVGRETIGSKVYYEYRCEKKHETFVKAEDVEIDWEDVVLSPIDCSRCNRYAEFSKYYTYGDDLYAIFTCEKGHSTYKKIDENIFDWDDVIKDDYTIRVYVTGSGNYTISGGSTADYGESKTIKFTPSKGYTLSKVTVNGDLVATADDEITIKVKEDTVIRATFVKNITKLTVTASATGNGSITATYGKKTVDASAITVGYGDTVTYKFVPASSGYYVSSLKVNGKSVSIPASGTFTLSSITADTKIAAVFSWKNPYSDLNSKYTKAVEYVTEAGIMGAVSADGTKLLFKGLSKVTEKDFAAALAEMADVSDKLDTTAERIAWAEKYDVVKEDADLSGICTVQAAAKMVDKYLAALEEINDIDFDKYDEDDSVKDNAVSIGMVTAKTYDGNRQLTRYDLASVCRLVANLKFDD